MIKLLKTLCFCASSLEINEWNVHSFSPVELAGSVYMWSTYIRHIIIYGSLQSRLSHDDVIKWKHFPRYWPFVRGIHRSPVKSPHKGQWRGALMFSLIWVWKNGWVNNGDAGDLRRHRAHYDVSVMSCIPMCVCVCVCVRHKSSDFYVLGIIDSL